MNTLSGHVICYFKEQLKHVIFKPKQIFLVTLFKNAVRNKRACVFSKIVLQTRKHNVRSDRLAEKIQVLNFSNTKKNQEPHLSVRENRFGRVIASKTKRAESKTRRGQKSAQKPASGQTRFVVPSSSLSRQSISNNIPEYSPKRLPL